MADPERSVEPFDRLKAPSSIEGFKAERWSSRMAVEKTETSYITDE